MNSLIERIMGKLDKKNETLGENIPMMMVVIRVSNPECIPKCILESTKQPKKEKISKGVEFISPQKNGEAQVGAHLLHQDINASGYKIVRACWEQKLNEHDKLYYLVRFEFVRNELLREKMEELEEVIKALETMLNSALWKVRVFRNPYFKNGEIQRGNSTISLNLNSRTPLHKENWIFDPELQKMVFKKIKPTMRWEKNKKGEKIKKIPLTAKERLVIRNNEIQVVPI
ncbi:MAG: hypothetical protein L3J07_03315 [Candidatus Magasanikbacteria bacterium]|nr:hypothetical protein [Candidatus Magasanikbacteria bacterium]